MSGGGLEDLFGGPAEPPAEVPEPVEKRRSPVLRALGEVALIAAATVVIVAALRSLDTAAPLLIIVFALVGLRLVMIAVAAVRAPRTPRGRPASQVADRPGDDSLRAAVRRWEWNLEHAHSDPERYARYVLPVLGELADERLRLRHGITRATDPRRARELLGDQLWTALAEPGRRASRARDLETYVNALERL